MLGLRRWSHPQAVCRRTTSIWQRGRHRVRAVTGPWGYILLPVIPYKDENPTVLTPVVTIGIITVNVLAWLFVQGAGSGAALAASVCQLGLIPAELFRTVPIGTTVPLGPGVACVIDSPHYAAVLTSMFMHGGWLHIIGNMWFLWVFGNNIEDSMGHSRFVVFYLLCGVVAAGAQLLTDSHSRVP